MLCSERQSKSDRELLLVYHMSDTKTLTMPHTLNKFGQVFSIVAMNGTHYRHLLISQSPNFLSCLDDDGSNVGAKEK